MADIPVFDFKRMNISRMPRIPPGGARAVGDRIRTMIRYLSLIIALVAPGLLGCGAPPRPDILLVTFDTVRADHVGYASGQPGLTPSTR